MPNWEEYIKLNLALPDPGAPNAVEELRKMVDTHMTLEYKGGKKGGTAKPIKPRRLGDLEFAKLEELLPIYEEKLKAWWEEENAAARRAAKSAKAAPAHPRRTGRKEAVQSDVHGAPPAKADRRRRAARVVESEDEAPPRQRLRSSGPADSIVPLEK